MSQPASLEAIATDAAAGFDDLVRRRIDASYRLATLILLDPVEAEDAAHDAFLKAARKWHSLRDPSLADAWFDRILVNECRDRLRHRRSHPVTDISDQLAQSLSVGDDAAAAVERDRMRRALARLSTDLRLVVVLRYYEDLPVDAVARRLEIPSGTVKSRLHQALRELTAALSADEREVVR